MHSNPCNAQSETCPAKRQIFIGALRAAFTCTCLLLKEHLTRSPTPRLRNQVISSKLIVPHTYAHAVVFERSWNVVRACHVTRSSVSVRFNGWRTLFRVGLERHVEDRIVRTTRRTYLTPLPVTRPFREPRGNWGRRCRREDTRPNQPLISERSPHLYLYIAEHVFPTASRSSAPARETY